jgi:hypothetical protein
LFVIPEGNLRLQSLHQEEIAPVNNIVISTEAVHSLIVNSAAERSPHFVSATMLITQPELQSYRHPSGPSKKIVQNRGVFLRAIICPLTLHVHHT